MMVKPSAASPDSSALAKALKSGIAADGFTIIAAEIEARAYDGRI